MYTKISIIIIGTLILFNSCASQPVDIGLYNPNNLNEEELVSLVINRAIKVHKIDNEEVDWTIDKDKHRVIKIPSGEHTFSVSFLHYNYYTLIPERLNCQFERGNTYLLDFSIKQENRKSIVYFYIFLYNDNKRGAMIIGN